MKRKIKNIIWFLVIFNILNLIFYIGKINIYAVLIVDNLFLILGVTLLYLSGKRDLKDIREIFKLINKGSQNVELGLSHLPGELRSSGTETYDIVKERNNLKSSYSKEKAYFIDTIDSLNDGFVTLDKDLKIRIINDQAMEILKLDESALNENIYEETFNIDIKKGLDKLRNTEIYAKKMNFNSVAHEVTFKKLKKNFGYLLIFHNIHEYLENERLRREFVNAVSHELKTPLTSIKGYGETLLINDNIQRDKQKEFLEIIVNESNNLREIVDDILGLGEIDETRSTPLDRSNIKFLEREDFLNLKDEMINIFKRDIENQEIEYDFILDESVFNEKEVSIRYNDLKRVLTNLISNSINYGRQKGQVSVNLQIRDCYLVIEVTDNGIGLNKEETQRIFERFYKVDKSRRSIKNSTGLGLSIVKGIVEMYRGTYEVQSELDKGSRFTVSLMLKEEK